MTVTVQCLQFLLLACLNLDDLLDKPKSVNDKCWWVFQFPGSMTPTIKPNMLEDWEPFDLTVLRAAAGCAWINAHSVWQNENHPSSDFILSLTLPA